MDIKKIKNINLNIEFKVTEERKKKIAALLFRNARLFFLIFLGLVTIYSFNVVFKKAYVDINYIQYPAYTTALGDGSIQPKLDKIMEVIEKRAGKAQAMADKEYADPFNYRDEEAAEEVAASDGENAGGNGEQAVADPVTP
jgi:hypothetical protein